MLIRKCDICNAEIDNDIVVLKRREKYHATKITVNDSVNFDVCKECTNKIIEYCNKHKMDTNDNVGGGGIIKTYKDIYDEFCKKFPHPEVEDYRPAVEMHIPQLSRGIPNAIIVWLKDGSKVIYIAESEV